MTLPLVAPLSQVLTDVTTNYVYGLERLRALGGPWYVGDALGSVRQTLDDAGAVVGTTSYDAWGVPQAALRAPFGFTGERPDQPATGTKLVRNWGISGIAGKWRIAPGGGCRYPHTTPGW